NDDGAWQLSPGSRPANHLRRSPQRQPAGRQRRLPTLPATTCLIRVPFSILLFRELSSRAGPMSTIRPPRFKIIRPKPNPLSSHSVALHRLVLRINVVTRRRDNEPEAGCNKAISLGRNACQVAGSGKGVSCQVVFGPGCFWLSF